MKWFWLQLLLLGLSSCLTSQSSASTPPSDYVLRESLERAVRRGDLAECDALVKDGAKVTGNISGLSPHTILVKAVLGGHRQIVELLINSGADVNAASAEEQSIGEPAPGELPAGITPLHAAALAGYPAVVQVLLERGANVNARDQGGRTPLHYACINGFQEIKRLLIAAGADPKARTNLGYTPADYELYHLSAEADVEGVKAALEAGADASVTYRALTDRPLLWDPQFKPSGKQARQLLEGA